MTYGYGDYVPEPLCTCETYWECVWHQQYRGRDVNRKELEDEMETVMDVSYDVYWGASRPEPGWELIKGQRCYYWRPH